MSKNNSSKAQLNTPHVPNQRPPLQNNAMGMQNQSQLGAGNYQNQNQNLRPPFMPNMQPQPPPMNTANHHLLPFQNNQQQQHMSHMGVLGPHNSVGNGNYNPVFPAQGQFMQNAAPINLSQLQGQILAQSILNMLQPNMNMNMNMNMSMPNGQFCAPYQVQNMNQQLPMQVPNPSQAVPYGMHPGNHPMYGFPNQVPQAMIPQNQMFSANPQFGLVPGNQVRPQVNPNEKNQVPPTVNTNAFASAPFSSQQLQGNKAALLNPNLAQPHHANNSQPSPFIKSHSKESPNSNIKTNFPNSNWKGGPSKNFKNKPNRGGFQGGFQKSKFIDINNENRRNGFPKEHKGKGPHNGRAGNFGSNSEELLQEPKRSFSVNYSEQEIQQWREARRKNHPFGGNIQERQTERLKDSKIIDREFLQKELKQVLAKQAELGVEVAEIPRYYLKDSANQGLQSEGRNTFTDKRNFENNSKRKSNRGSRFAKKQKFAGKDFSESPSLNKREPTLLQKLLSADMKRDKSHLFQVFRFMVVNSFFKHYPDKPLIYPSVAVKEIGSEGDCKENRLHNGKSVFERGSKVSVEKIVNHDSDNGHDSEDDESDVHDENDSTVPINPSKESSSLVKRQCDNGDEIDKSEEEGEILE